MSSLEFGERAARETREQAGRNRRDPPAEEKDGREGRTRARETGKKEESGGEGEANVRAGRCRGNWAEEAARERIADALLRAHPRDPDCPFYSERQLARHGRDCMTVTRICVERWGDLLESACPPQSARDELLFLAAITPLDARERTCLRAWILGWTQAEARTLWQDGFEGGSQQTVSRVLRSALCKCYDGAALTFAAFSRHTLYRRPAARRDRLRTRICAYCQETFVTVTRVGCYCSSGCEAASQHRD